MKIFVASTGRSGTYFMTKVFEQYTDIPSYHEGTPKCINTVLKEVNTFNLSKETKEVLKEKIKRITACSKNGAYFESNHMFIKSFYQTVLDNFQSDVYCIYLHRNIQDVLISFTQMDNHLQLDDWFLKSNWGNNCFQTIEPLSGYQNIVWNWFEVRERFYSLGSRFAKVWDFPFTKLNSVAEWKKMFAHFGIKAKDGFSSLKAFPKDLGKNQLIADSKKPVEDMLQRVRDNWDYINTKGWAFPTDYSELMRERKQQETKEV